jgi:hypothetical protein
VDHISRFPSIPVNGILYKRQDDLKYFIATDPGYCIFSHNHMHWLRLEFSELYYTKQPF